MESILAAEGVSFDAQDAKWMYREAWSTYGAYASREVGEYLDRRGCSLEWGIKFSSPSQVPFALIALRGNCRGSMTPDYSLKLACAPDGAWKIQALLPGHTVNAVHSPWFTPELAEFFDPKRPAELPLAADQAEPCLRAIARAFVTALDGVAA